MTNLNEAYLALKSAKIVDLTHQITEDSPRFPLLPPLEKKDIFTLKDGFHVQQFTVVGQYGTHIDAPVHFVEGGAWLDELPLEDLLLPLYVIDKSQEVAENPNIELTKADILAFEKENGQIAAGSFVAFRSDWSKRWPNQDQFRNLDDLGVQQTPGWSHEALEFLIHERQVKAVGHETFDTDSGQAAAKNGKLAEEYYLLEQGIYQLEVLANLDQVPATGSLIAIAYPHWEKATGSPVRAIAYVPQD
ncbi:cyclase family protein [Streptococcus macacae]|uniref:Cyclase n=1 Tax=Streptococcus macacae NCTC 11558 TaxID=764298 RepID=G5JVH2_9STRE|nr:cyclase family protein [Streptococcus macacae]EHJ53018.1 putative cyclase [Streptococcus macacae NCTC 11558]SUN78567.1 putative cyclase enzyme [Streptococcus macacae NCTC 11558]